MYAKKVHKFTTKIVSQQKSVNNLCFGRHTWWFFYRDSALGVLVGILGVLVGVGGICICDCVYVTWDGAFDTWDELSCNFITQRALFAFIFGMNKFCSKQSLLRSLWKKVHRLEKSTPTPWYQVCIFIWTNKSLHGFGQCQKKLICLYLLHMKLFSLRNFVV